MFPQPGAPTPEIRFKGFFEPWKETKLGDVGDTQSGIGFSDAEQGGTTGTPFFKVSDMNRAGNELEMFTSNNYVSEEQLKRKGWTPISNVPSVIFAKVGAALMLNRKRLINQPFLIDNNLMAYLFDAIWDTDFGRVLFETINLPLYAQVGALPSYNGSDIESITVQLPGKAEQQKIGTYFRTLDELITKHATQLQKLQQIKSACLEKMFV
jgi:type I restriction enzyme S subunit